MLISAKECDKNKTQIATETTMEMSDRNTQENMKLTYQAVSRGFFLKIWVEGDSLSFTSDYNLKEVNTYQISQEEKEALLTLLNNIDATALPGLESPSKAHQYDGAAIATFEISKDEEIYKTSAFDHGNPSVVIKDLVEKMLSIKTMLEKQ